MYAAINYCIVKYKNSVFSKNRKVIKKAEIEMQSF